LSDERFQSRFEVPDNRTAEQIFGHLDENLRVIQEAFPVEIASRGNAVLIGGEAADREAVLRVFAELLEHAASGGRIGVGDVRQAIRSSQREGGNEPQGAIVVTTRGRGIRPKTSGQRTYVEAIRGHDIAFGIGPAGTGKTYLAMAMAVAALKARQVQRIILTRPAVEAGEKLGFLPGDLQDKVDPYLRPLYDALFDILGMEQVDRLRERAVLEIAPLAYMRGRTLDDSFIILDEAQNTTPEQMKMFLTRMGFGSKAVITGDVTQVDLPRGQFSGLQEAADLLRDIEGIAFVYLDDRDVVRHELVQKIIKAYEMRAQSP
jgi:phosphate starvation-inducible PhoH-like protein